MEYKQFIQQSIKLITQSRIQQLSGTTNIITQIINCKMPILQQPTNIYLQMYLHNETQKIKIQQWSFITHKTLYKSINQQDKSQDSDFDTVQIQNQNFFTIIKKLMINITPKLIYKPISPHTLQFLIILNQNLLTSMQGQNTFVIKVGQYQSEYYQCSVNLKYNYEYDQQQQHQFKSSGKDSCQFQLLIDPVLQQKKKQEQYVQYRKLSEGNLYQRQISPQPLKKKNSKVENQHFIIQSKQRGSQMSRLSKLHKQINFENKVLSSTLQQFLIQ